MRVEIPIVGPSYTDETRRLAVEECINLMPEKVETSGARARFMLRTSAGLAIGATLVSGSVRGIHSMGGILYAVTGETLYRVNSDGSTQNLGTILGSSRVVMADNFVPDTKRQLVIWTGDRTYVYDTLLGLVEITDPDYIAVARQDGGTFIDGYILATTEDGFIYSEITDATNWNALSFVTAESATDQAIAVHAVYGDAWVFGGRTTEVFRNTGAADNPWQRVQTFEKGIGAKFSPVNLDNSVFWIDESGRVNRASGFSPVRISTHAIEQYMQSVDFSQAFGFTYVDRGHEFYCFTVPNGRTYLYDVATGLWHRRASQDLTFWRVSGQALAYGERFFGDYQSALIWRMDDSVVAEGPYRLVRERITGYASDDNRPLFISQMEIVADTGNAPQSFDGTPQIELCRSYDGGHNWKNWSARSIGKIGEFGKRIRWFRLAMGRQIAFHLRISDPVRCDLITATMDVDAGDV